MTPTTLLLSLAAFSGQPDVLVYDFTSTRCAPCQQMNPIVERLQRQGYPIQKVDIDQNRGMMNQYQVASIPTFVLVVNGQEVTRIVGSTSEQSLLALFEQVPRPTADIKAPDPRGSTPQRTLPASMASSSSSQSLNPFPSGTRIATGLTGLERAQLGSSQPFESTLANTPSKGNVELLESPARTQPSSTALAQNASPSYNQTATQNEQVVIRGQAQEEPDRQQQPKLDARGASVRLRISVGDQIKFGSGTVIQSRPGHSIVLTCGHLFENLTEETRIEVNVFEGDQYQNYVGRLIKAVPNGIDLGLVELKTDQVLPIARLAVAQTTPQVSERLYSLGCSRGENPTLQRVDVTAIDDYEGPPNLECTGMPDPGRSGGGLFNAQQELLGVCIRMNPKNERGLYTSLDPILDLLQRNELAHLIRGDRATNIAYNHELPQESFASNGNQNFDAFASNSDSFSNTPAQSDISQLSTPSQKSQQNLVLSSETGHAGLMTMQSPAQAMISNADQQILGNTGVGSRLTILIQDPHNPANTRTVIINSASPRLIADLLGEQVPAMQMANPSDISTAEIKTRANTVPTAQSQTNASMFSNR